ncbi:hypothetical protein [Paludibacterium yongneupense]|uniref:hypothetical protein n=1 Tax=Paludibacterium yongneupense TaxID=400061 RepID=UPI0004252F4F|nr:hypothetical protein [Paludibacterium yongneupense]
MSRPLAEVIRVRCARRLEEAWYACSRLSVRAARQSADKSLSVSGVLVGLYRKAHTAVVSAFRRLHGRP